MTRFARAKGSKASNLKDPEDGTPWEVMKEQLLKAKAESEESKKRKEAEQQRINNYENFLKERKVEKRKAEWCDFPESKTNVNTNQNALEGSNKKIKKAKQNSMDKNTEEINKVPNGVKNKKKIKANKLSKTSEISPEVVQSTENKETKQSPVIEDVSTHTKNNYNIQPNTGAKKKNKNKKKAHNNTDINTHQDDQKQTVESNKKNKKQGEEAVRRKEITERSFKLIINGKDVELVRFDGFPIMKKDAERLQELKSSMIKKGIPKSEVQRTIKLERRRAEKALARIKRDVCYNCRKGGHNLSDCPDLKSNIPGVGSADGVCFKCGSTEHRQNECKVQRDKEFRFATCFICRETGHLARQCPDNPKGLYPNGGCCKLCGDVTHLRKDCPTVAEKKESTSIKLPTLDGAENLEDIEQSNKIVTSTETSRKPKKIKF